MNTIRSEATNPLTNSLHEVRSVFSDSGVSIAEWARVNGFSTGLVYQVLEGRRKCMRGQSYRIAIALGLRDGVPLDAETLSLRLKGKSLQPNLTKETEM